MPVFLSSTDTNFPPAQEADEHGIVAIGGDLGRERLINAYRSGIFPWPHEGLPTLWFCPDPRFVLKPEQFVVNETLKKILRRSSLSIKADQNFYSVIKKCAQRKRKDQDGTWISDEMMQAYLDLHLYGLAHSVEAYDNDLLVGGLYGISLGTIFFGESMFFEQKDASKICLATLVAHLLDWQFSLIDCQVYSQHLEKLGGYFMSRAEFLRDIKMNETNATKKGHWQFYFSLPQVLMRIQKPFGNLC
jgi:leucyl/phenylalanyl-tRNA---protein transferase